MINKEECFKIVNQHIIDVLMEFTVTDDSGNIIDELSGVISGGTINVDSGSSVRRTASLSITPTKQITNINEKSLIWLNKNVSIRVGILNQRTKERYWFNQGKYLYENASTTYDSTNNLLTVDLSDWVLKLDGTVNGQVGGMVTTVIQAYEEDTEGVPISYTTIKKALEDILKSGGISPSDFNVCDIGEYYAFPEHNEDWQEYREKHPLWNMIPYDLEFSAGVSVWDMVTEIVELYPNYDAAYDENGKFIVRLIPSEYEDENDFDYEDYLDMVISEQVQTSLTNVYNICEVWGESMDTDWYSDTVTSDNNYYNITLEGYPTDGYRTGNRIAIAVDTTNRSGQLFKVNNLPALPIIDQTTGDVIEAGALDVNHIHVFYIAKVATESESGTTDVTRPYSTSVGDNINKIASRFGVTVEELRAVNSTISDADWNAMLTFINVGTIINVIAKEFVNPNYVNQAFYLGVEQSHAIDVLTDGTVIENGYTDPYTHEVFDKFSKEYYQHIWNCDNVSLTIIEDSPFTVQKIGERIDVKEGGEFSNITSNELALERAQYENWKNSRLTDDVTITTKLMPFVEPYMKVSYKKNGYKNTDYFIVKSVSHDFDNGTSTISMYTFYPLYRQKPGTDNRMTYKFMSGYLNKDLYGDEDEDL